MWLIEYLPDSMVALVVATICLLGIVAWGLSKAVRWFPAISAYKLPLELAGVVLLVFGAYLQGGRANEAVWQQKVTELEVKIKEAEAKAAQENVKIVEKVVEKTRTIKEKGATEIQYVDRIVKEKEEIIKYVERCPVPQELLDAHNRAAQMGIAK